MKPDSAPAPAGFADLSKLEQIDYVQALSDLLADEVDDIPVLETQVTEVERRLAEHHLHPNDVLPAYEALDKLRLPLA